MAEGQRSLHLVPDVQVPQNQGLGWAGQPGHPPGGSRLTIYATPAATRRLQAGNSCSVGEALPRGRWEEGTRRKHSGERPNSAWSGIRGLWAAKARGRWGLDPGITLGVRIQRKSLGGHIQAIEASPSWLCLPTHSPPSGHLALALPLPLFPSPPSRCLLLPPPFMKFGKS